MLASCRAVRATCPNYRHETPPERRSPPLRGHAGGRHLSRKDSSPCGHRRRPRGILLTCESSQAARGEARCRHRVKTDPYQRCGFHHLSQHPCQVKGYGHGEPGRKGVIDVEDWAEIRRLHCAEGLSTKAIVRGLGVSRNTVRDTLLSGEPPRCERARSGSVVDAVEPRVRELLREFPAMSATVIA